MNLTGIIFHLRPPRTPKHGSWLTIPEIELSVLPASGWIGASQTSPPSRRR